MNTEKFDLAYRRLNPAQKEAVDTIDGPVMVVAGPGTGKTQILTLRIANICLKSDTEPKNILALTFTDAASASMRARLVDIMGSSGYSVVIKTFHSFCNDIIQKYAEYFPNIIGSEHIIEVDQIKLLKEIIEELPLKDLRPFNNHYLYLYDVRSSISSLKREAIDAEEFKKIVSEDELNFENTPDLYYDSGAHKGKMKGKYQDIQKDIVKNKELSKIYSTYEALLISRHLYDYDDMIMEVLKALSLSDDLLLRLQEEHQYILVDEHQDTNRAQNKILELLANFHDNPNIFVVGDEKQAIFRFQGASLENFYYFKHLYPKAKFVVLEENYRSTQPILDSAHSLLAGPKPLKSQSTTGEKIRLFPFSTEIVENFFVASDIKKKIDSGVQPQEIAVLYRENNDAKSIAEALGKVGVPFVVESNENILFDEGIRKIILLLRAVNDFGDQRSFIEAMHIDFWKIDPFDIYRLLRYVEVNRTNIFEALKDDDTLINLGIDTWSAMRSFYESIKRWAVTSKNESLLYLLEHVIRSSGYLQSVIKSDDPIGNMEKINGLFEEIREFVESHRRATLNDLIEHFNLLEEHKLSLKKSQLASGIRGVRLMTAHRSKGLEFDFVYIIRAYDGKWGNKRNMTKLELPKRIYSVSDGNLSKDIASEFDENDDERRLFFVALTRARKGVTISYAKEAGKKEKTQSLFVSEINQELIDFGDSSPYEASSGKYFETILSERAGKIISIKDKDLIKEIIDAKGISATDLNNYLTCPWRYFYNGLFRLPEAPQKHLMYGNAMHGALKDLFDKLKRDGREALSKDYLISQFRHYLNREPLTEKELAETLEKGKQSLSGYFDLYAPIWLQNVFTEFDIRGVILEESIMIKGRIDKIELLDGSSNTVNVVDYKTGRPKTRNEIEGETQNSEGNIKRQLVFYQLLLDNYENNKFKMVSADIDFIDPDPKTGKYRKERFIIAPEEVEEIRSAVKSMYQDIISLSFIDKRCNDKDCEFCQLGESVFSSNDEVFHI